MDIDENSNAVDHYYVFSGSLDGAAGGIGTLRESENGAGRHPDASDGPAADGSRLLPADDFRCKTTARTAVSGIVWRQDCIFMGGNGDRGGGDLISAYVPGSARRV